MKVFMYSKNYLYEELFIRNFESLCAYVYSYIPDVEAAKDIVQDTFLTLWKNWDRYQPSDALLYTIARNKTLDYVKAGYQTKVLKGIPVEMLARLSQPLYGEEDEWKEIMEEIWKYVEKLPGQCRKIFILSRHENLKNKEIAAQLNISVKTVEKQITKALGEIRSYLLANGFSFRE